MPETDLKRTDYEPYFERWNAVIFYPNPAAGPNDRVTIHGHSGEIGTVPCYVHKTCNAYVKLGSGGLGKYPPRVCPGCEKDTAKEQEEISRLETTGGVLLG